MKGGNFLRRGWLILNVESLNRQKIEERLVEVIIRNIMVRIVGKNSFSRVGSWRGKLCGKLDFWVFMREREQEYYFLKDFEEKFILFDVSMID